MLQPQLTRGNDNVIETTLERFRRLKIRTPIYQLWDHDDVKTICEKQSRLEKAEPKITPPKYPRKYIDLPSDYGWKLVFGSEN